jgi:hypothetical protein
MSQFLTVKCQFYRLRFFPTSISAEKWVYPDFRKEDEDFLTSYLRNGDVVIDIGANVGTLTLTAAHLVGASGKVFSIEAHPVIFIYLKDNVALNKFKMFVYLMRLSVTKLVIFNFLINSMTS